MKRCLTIAAFAVSALLLDTAAIAQNKDEKEKSKNKIGEYDEIIIKRKDAGKNGKVTIEIKDDEVKVNGKPLEQFDDDNLSVRRKKAMAYGLVSPSPFRSEDMNFGDGRNFLYESDRPF